LGRSQNALRAVAKFWVKVDAGALERLTALTSRLNRPSAGIDGSQRAKLAQFQEPTVLRRFLRMGPEGFIATAAKKRLSRRDAVGSVAPSGTRDFVTCTGAGRQI